jgi:hypothetical protein
MEEHGRHCNCMADNTILHREVYREASGASAEILAGIL